MAETATLDAPQAEETTPAHDAQRQAVPRPAKPPAWLYEAEASRANVSPGQHVVGIDGEAFRRAQAVAGQALRAVLADAQRVFLEGGRLRRWDDLLARLAQTATDLHADRLLRAGFAAKARAALAELKPADEVRRLEVWAREKADLVAVHEAEAAHLRTLLASERDAVLRELRDALGSAWRDFLAQWQPRAQAALKEAAEALAGPYAAYVEARCHTGAGTRSMLDEYLGRVRLEIPPPPDPADKTGQGP
jgi:hypothetical protein